jgi:hypothetical protein
MLTKVTKWSALAALIGVALSRSLPGVTVPFQLAVTAAAIVVLIQSVTMRRYVGMSLFFMVACLFNPVFPVRLSGYMSGWATTFAVLLFFFSLELLKPRPTLAIVSSTDRMSGSSSR